MVNPNSPHSDKKPLIHRIVEDPSHIQITEEPDTQSKTPEDDEEHHK